MRETPSAHVMLVPLQILETVKTYGDSVHQSIKQGTAFNDVSEKTAQAAEYVRCTSPHTEITEKIADSTSLQVAELSTRLKSAKTFGDLPVSLLSHA